MLRVLVVLGHPRTDSFGAALMQAYCSGLDHAGVEYRTLRLSELTFNPDVRLPSPADQTLEPDLAQAQRLIAWANHLVFVYPNWWGTMPALLKGFLDRVLTPGFAFRFHTDGSWDKLLEGRTAELLVTMDTPRWVYRWIYGAPGHRAMARATLGFCGVRTVRAQSFGVVERSSPVERRQWLEQAAARGRSLARGGLSRRQRFQDRAAIWLRALRLQFYPMTWIAYTIGALLAVGAGPLQLGSYWIGYLCLFALEAATVFSNEYFDYDSDRRNTNAGPFNGGSRVLTDGSVRFGQMRMAIGMALLATALLAWWLLAGAVSSPAASAAVLGVLAVFALGYTVPPLKLSHRGFGELDVAATHSFGVVLCGFVFQGGVVWDGSPWLVSVPLFLSVLAAITLSGIPDRDADWQAGKRTMVVQVGVAKALKIALGSTLAAPALALLIDQLGFAGRLYGAWIWPAVLHALVAALLIGRRLRQPDPLPGLNPLMVISLSLILWFGIPPLVRLY